MYKHIYNSFSGLSPRLWLLAFVSFINRFGAMVICFLSLYLTHHLRFSLTDAGYILSCYGLGAIVGSYLGGHLTDKWGYQKVQILSLVSAGVLLIGLMYLRNFYSICAMLFVYNIMNESFRPANSVAIKQNSHEGNRTRAYSLMRTSFNLAISFALSFGGILIAWGGWKMVFIADAVTCWLAAIMILLFVPTVNAKSTPIPIIDKKPIPLLNPTSPYKDKPFLIFLTLTFLNALVFMQILWTVPPFFKDVYLWDEGKIGWVCALNGAIVVLVEMPLVARIEAKYPNLFWVKWGIICYALAYLSLLLPFSLLAAILYMIVISLGEIWVMPFSTTWIVERTTDQTQGKYMGLYGISYSAANTLAPLLGTQVITHWGYDIFWTILSFICVLVWLGLWLLERNLPKDANPQT